VSLSSEPMPEHPPHLALWRNRDFRLLWGGHTISMLGSQITLIALPLIAALTLQATPAQMAILMSLGYAPATLIGLFAGVLIDRVRRRPLMIITDLLSAGLLLLIPLMVQHQWLNIEALYVVSFLLSIAGVFYGLADGAFLPTLVPREQLAQANGMVATSSSTMRVIGPGLAALLIQWLTAPIAVVIDAATFLVSALSAAFIRTVEPLPPAQERQPHICQDIAEGLSATTANPYLRAFILSAAALDIFWNALYAVYVLFITRELGLPPATIGLIFSVGSMAALIGAPIAAPIARRFGVGRVLISSQILIGCGSLLIALPLLIRPAALPFLIVAEIVQAGANTISYINRDSVRQAVTPGHLRGRIGASTMCFGLGAALLGTFLGGVLGEQVGISSTIIIGAVGGTFSFLWLMFSPVRRLHDLADLS
jgi:MFS family permease